MPKFLLRISLVFGGLLLMTAGLGIGLDLGGGRALWPWPDGRLSYIFVSSILLAEATVMLWQASTLELSAAKGGAVGFLAMNLCLAAFMFNRFADKPETMVLVWALVCSLLACSAVILLLQPAKRFPSQDTRPTPPIVRWSFLVFAGALFTATTMLILKLPIVFPWPLKPESSVVFGFLFLASAVYFFDGFLRPSWANAKGQLLGFLIYDLVLIAPWLAHFPKSAGGFRISLSIYIIVLVWSGVLAIYFLFMNPKTRLQLTRAVQVSA